ncbi:MAG TPA: hypothetical protein VMU82_08200 [Acetobacteraceae bacterium]|nr:hypothetical protein [Acetobacteraceae bacterium]
MAATAMRLAMWAYPWDVQDLGIDTVTADLRGRAGLNAISLAASYHAGRFLQPRSPVRKAYFPEDGTVYFHPDPALWDDKPIRPRLAGIIAERGDILAALIEQRARTGLSVSCWTVCLHNTRLGMRHPDACTRNAFGDPSYFSLCPSHPGVRAYATTLVQDLTRRYRPDVVELESPGFMGFAHGYHHEKDGVGLTAEDDFLLSLCFCPACVARSARAGVDAEAARRTVRGWIAEAMERAVPAPRWPDFQQSGPEVFVAHPDVQAYVMWRFEPVTSLVAAIRDAADPASRVHVLDIDDGWLSGSDLGALGRAADGVTLCVYDRSPEEIGAAMAKARAALGAGRYLGAGLRVFHPEMRGPEDLATRARAARAAGANGLNFYNYGLIPAARLDWVATAAAA